MSDSSPTGGADVAAGRKLMAEEPFDASSIAANPPSDFGSEATDEEFADTERRGAPPAAFAAAAAPGGPLAGIEEEGNEAGGRPGGREASTVANDDDDENNMSLVVYGADPAPSPAPAAAAASDSADDSDAGEASLAAANEHEEEAESTKNNEDVSTLAAVKEEAMAKDGAAGGGGDGKRSDREGAAVAQSSPFAANEEGGSGGDSLRRRQPPVADETPNRPTPPQPAFKFQYNPPEHEREYYDRLFHHANQTPPQLRHRIHEIVLPPNLAARLFLLAGLPTDRLRMIWNMAVMPATPYPPDAAPPPAMTVGQFRSAVRLIQLFQNRVTAKDETLTVGEEGARGMSPAFFAGVSGAAVPLPRGDTGGAAARAGFGRRHSSLSADGSSGGGGRSDPVGRRSSATSAHARLPGAGKTSNGAGGYDGPDPDAAYAMSDDEAHAYLETFARHCVVDSQNVPERHVVVDEAVALFSESGLPSHVLGRLGDVVATDGDDGKLDEGEFVLMAHLIACVTRRGLGVPGALPAPLRAWREENGGNSFSESSANLNDSRHHNFNSSKNINNSNNNAIDNKRGHGMNTGNGTVEHVSKLNDKKDCLGQQKQQISINRASLHQRERIFMPIKRNSNVTVDSSSSLRSGNDPFLNSNPKSHNRSEEHRMKRMEQHIASLKTLVQSLLEEVKDLKDLVREGGNEADSAMGEGIRMPPKTAQQPSSHDDVPNVDLEVYWGQKRLDNSDKKQGSSKSSFSMPNEMPPMPSSLNPSFPSRQTSSPPLLNQPRQFHPQPQRPTLRTVKVEGMSRNIPQMHPSAMGGGGTFRSRRSRMMHSRVPQGRMAGQQTMPDMSNGGVSSNSMANVSDVQASHTRQVQKGEGVGSLPSRKNHLLHMSMPQARVAGQQAMPVVSNGGDSVAKSMSSHGTSHARTSQMKQAQQGYMPATSQHPRSGQSMHSVLSQSRVPVQQTVQAMSHGAGGAAIKSTPKNARDDGLAESLTSQMKQIQREEVFDSLMRKTVAKLGSAASDTKSLASSFNSRDHHSQRSALRSSLRNGANRTRTYAHVANDVSFKPAQLKFNVAPAKLEKDKRAQFSSGRRSHRASIVDSSRHIVRRTSGESEIYKELAEPRSTAAVDLPPL